MADISGLLDGVEQTLFPTAVPKGASYDLDTMRMARAALLGNIGASLLAAGQGGQSQESRAAHLARLGQGPAAASEIMSAGSQNQLRAMQIRQAQQEMADKAARDKFFRDSISGIGAGASGQAPVAPTAAPAASPPGTGAATPTPIVPPPPVAPPANDPGLRAPYNVQPVTPKAVAAANPAPPPVTPPQAVQAAVRPTGGKTWWEQLQISPQMATQIAALPDSQRQQVITKLITDRATPREVWTDVTDGDGKLLGQRNSLTGKFERNGPQTEVNINQEKGWNELDQKRVSAAFESVDSREKTIMPQMRVMHQMLVSGQVDPNALQGVLMPLRGMLSAAGFLSAEESQKLSDDQLFQKLSTQVLPSMRPPGSGSSSDRDMDLFMRGNANITDQKEAALKATAFMIQSQAYQAARANLMMEYARTNKGGLAGFDQYAQQKLGPVIPNVSTAEELQALPKGTLFKDPKGRFQVKVVD